MLSLRHFPDRWKDANIMLPKPGKYLSFPQNYLSINLLPAMSKIAERPKTTGMDRRPRDHTRSVWIQQLTLNRTIGSIHRRLRRKSKNKRYSHRNHLGASLPSNPPGMTWWTTSKKGRHGVSNQPHTADRVIHRRKTTYGKSCNSFFSDFSTLEAGLPLGALLSTKL